MLFDDAMEAMEVLRPVAMQIHRDTNGNLGGPHMAEWVFRRGHSFGSLDEAVTGYLVAHGEDAREWEDIPRVGDSLIRDVRDECMTFIRRMELFLSASKRQRDIASKRITTPETP